MPFGIPILCTDYYIENLEDWDYCTDIAIVITCHLKYQIVHIGENCGYYNGAQFDFFYRIELFKC
jgi:hypothetical protein